MRSNRCYPAFKAMQQCLLRHAPHKGFEGTFAMKLSTPDATLNAVQDQIRPLCQKQLQPACHSSDTLLVNKCALASTASYQCNQKPLFMAPIRRLLWRPILDELGDCLQAREFLRAAPRIWKAGRGLQAITIWCGRANPSALIRIVATTVQKVN